MHIGPYSSSLAYANISTSPRFTHSSTMYHLSEHSAVLMDTTQNTPNAYTSTMLRMPTEPATNTIMWSRWPCGFSTKRQSTTRLPTMPGDSLSGLQAWLPSMETRAEALMTQTEATQAKPRTNHHTRGL